MILIHRLYNREFKVLTWSLYIKEEALLTQKLPINATSKTITEETPIYTNVAPLVEEAEGGVLKMVTVEVTVEPLVL